MTRAVLVTGGTGYLGQFVVANLARDHKVGFTYNSSIPPIFDGDVTGFKVDLASGEGLQRAIHQLGGVQTVINCAAISQPVACENSPDMARSINVPLKLLDFLERQKQSTGLEASLIHLSTDQVYDGGKAFWKESDPCKPVNAYGVTKLEAEEAIKAKWPRSAILRSSIIYGPEPPQPVGRGLFLQFVDSALAKGDKTTFFNDEYRCPVFVDDILRVIRACMRRLQDSAPTHPLVFNMGGPQRMSRVDMAVAVADARGHGREAIVEAPAASVNRGVASPADISMDIRQLQEELGVAMTPFLEGLKAMGMDLSNT